ncbi:MAG: 30S ribosomal protein S9 [Alistipes sp.]|nr:30S ribosomal protein S9 [Alistipes sp.]
MESIIMSNSNEIYATGRRKTATARVRIFSGSGKIKVNGVDFEQYFEVEALRGFILQPLNVSGTNGQYDVCAVLSGGGKSGQAGALRHGISRALVKADEDLRKVFACINYCMTRQPSCLMGVMGDKTAI